MAITQGNPQSVFDAATGGSTTYSNYTVPAGSNRALLVYGAGVKTTEAGITLTAAFNGTLTAAITNTGTSTSRSYANALFYKLLGSGNDETNNVVLTAPNTASRGIYIVTLFGVDQTLPIFDTAESDAIPAVMTLDNGAPDGAYSLFCSLAAASNLVFSNNGGLETAFSLSPGSADSTELVTAGYSVIDATDQSRTLTITRSSSPPAQVSVAIKFQPAVANSIVSFANQHYRRMRQQAAPFLRL